MQISTMRARHPALVRAVLELGLVLGLWVTYSASRLLAETAMRPALDRANELLGVEVRLGIHWEPLLNDMFSTHRVLGLLGSYWYATAHYVVTGICLLWLYRLGAERYLPARRALAVATLLGLVAYLFLPTAPPRFVQGYVDVLSLHASDGWWSAEASAPRGVGGLTNELAAFPSLHAGWALWVAISLQRHAPWPVLRLAGWAYAAGTCVVIVGTGNHWVIDVVVGWLVVLVGFVVADGIDRAHELLRWVEDEESAPPTGEPSREGAPAVE